MLCLERVIERWNALFSIFARFANRGVISAFARVEREARIMNEAERGM